MTKRKIILRTAGRTSAHVSSRALILVDSNRLKAEEQKKCQKLYQTLESARKAVEIHESQSVPEFQKWLHSTFGKQLTTLRELTHKVMELENLIEAVEEQSLMSGTPPWKAYETLLKYKARAEKIEEDPLFSSESESQSEESKEELFRSAFESFFGTKKQWKSRHQAYGETDTETYEEAFERFKKEIEGAEAEEEPRFERSQNGFKEKPHEPKLPPESSTQTKTSNTRVKEYYRSLARKLHPDLNPGLEPKKLELWHQVQEAYEAHDLSRLEALAALSEMFEQSWNKIEGISTLRHLFQELKRTLKQFEKKIRLARKDKSWKFNETMKYPQQLKALKSQIANELNFEQLKLTDHQDELQSIIDSWSKPSKKRKRSRAERDLKIDGNLSEFEIFSELFR